MSAPKRIRESLVSTTANPDRTAATVDYSGLAAHPVIAAMGDADTDEAKAAAVLRWLAADWDGDGCKCWRCIVDLADEVEAAGGEATP